MSNSTKQALSTPRRALVDLMRDLGFGTISALPIRDGEPHLAPATVQCEIKLNQSDPRHQSGGDDFQLKDEVVRLFEHFDRLDNTIVRIEVRYGLPDRIIFAIGNGGSGK